MNVLAVSLPIGVACLASISAHLTSSNELDENDQAPYEQIISRLRQDDSVIPWKPDMHPVSAVYNREAIVPPQCYTKRDGTSNPCYVCHQDAVPGRENVMNDRDLQSEYSFSELGGTNHWANLFEDRTERIAKISDEEITAWTKQDNYSDLAQRLRDARFGGWIPDLEGLQNGRDAFDENGFAKDGSGWVAFSYKPLPSTFWPTNGSTDDVMIRLPEPFRANSNGELSNDIYRVNLSILEAMIKGFAAIDIAPVDEKLVGTDLNRDGSLTVVDRITNFDNYVGGADFVVAETSLYPAGTEFLHTVRYLGVTEDGAIVPSTRMKEVRYMKKWAAYSKPIYARKYQLEGFEKEAGNLPGYQYLGDYGLDNGTGWAIHGFIEDKSGALRASTYEENFFCMGCHSSIGSTVDKTFSFARKIDGVDGWKYIDLKGMPDAPTMGETKGEIATYLERVGGGNEFRSNDEMKARWFKKDGTVDTEKVSQARDVYDLIVPSPERALALDKAYRTIVEDQDFIFGRDASITPPENVYQSVDNKETPTLPEKFNYDWNIQLDWQNPSRRQPKDSDKLVHND